MVRVMEIARDELTLTKKIKYIKYYYILYNLFRYIGLYPTGSNPEKDKNIIIYYKEGSVCWFTG